MLEVAKRGSASERSASRDLTVQDLFAGRAAAAPDAIAVSGPDETLTYGQLERRANQLAHRLRALGVDRDQPVGLCVERSAALIVGALGILKAGGAYVALDPSHPTQRLLFTLDDCGAKVLVTSGQMAAQLVGAEAVAVPLDAGKDELDLELTVAPAAVATSDSLAYVIYTSGSTGTPKGVLVEQASLGNLVAWHQRAFAITATDRAMQVASPAFDAVVWELWPYLTVGASIHTVPDGVRGDPVALRDWMVAERISVGFLPTALAEAVMAVHWPADVPLRYLLTGGDTLNRYPPPDLPFSVVNNYGPTEGTVVATSGVVPSRADPVGAPSIGSADPVGAPSIGTPIANVRAYVVDDRLDPVAVGEPGELLIGGDCLARGYLNRPELNVERFIPDWFRGEPGARLYRTGDVVRQRPNGELEYLGRVDDQVKIMGNRIELGEISATLQRHPAVGSCVVVVGEPASDQRRLIAYVVAGDGGRPDAGQLRDHLAQQLPNHMIPAVFVWLEELPVTSSGKINRSALPAPSAANIAQPADSARPECELEQALENIVAELLELDRVGVDENFFMIGGHSLLGAQLIERIGDRFGVEMDLRSLFDGPTVAEMAIEVERLLVVELEAMDDEEAAGLLAASAPMSPETSGDEPHRWRR